MGHISKKTSKWQPSPEATKKICFVILALIVFISILAIPTPEGLSNLGHRVLAIYAFVVILWITETFPLGVTALIGIVALSLLGILEPKDAFAGFGSHTLFFLIGGLSLGIAMMRTNLHKRISLMILSKFGKSPRRLLFSVMFLGAAMSMTMPEHAVAAMMLPVIVGILSTCGVERGKSNFGIALLLALTYGTSVGSMGSLLGGSRNVIAISLLRDATGQSISFLDWMIVGIPISISMLIFTYLLITFVYKPEEIDMSVTIEHIKHEVSLIGKMSDNEKKAATIFILAFLLWMTVGTTIGLAVVAIAAMVLLLITKTITWEDIEKNMPWGILFLYGGAITLSAALVQTKAADFIASNIIGFVGLNPFLIILAVVVLTIYVTETISNAAATAAILPIAISVFVTIGLPPMIAMYAVAMCSAMAFMLPIATPSAAIAYSSGYLSMHDLIKAGMWLNLIGIATFMTIGLGWLKLLGVW